MFKDLRQTGKYSEYIKRIGWGADKFEDIYIFSRKILFWRFVKIQRPEGEIAKLLNGYIAEKFKYSTVYIEPKSNSQYNELLELGFRKYNSPFLPSKTIQIDLTKPEVELLKEMHPKTRYNIRKAISDKRKVIRSNDIDKFADFWQSCASKRGMFLGQKEEIKAIYDAFGKEAVIHLVADNDNNWLSAILRISTKDTSYYMYAAATDEGKKLFAPTVSAWDAIISAKKEGKRTFDFEGIYDERFPLRSWRGFSRFKKGFGGTEIEYPGTLCKVMYWM